MKPHTFGRLSFALATLITFGALFSPVSAATVSIINNWQDPAPYSFYSYNSHVHVTGSYTLPTDWVGTIYVWQDGVQLPQTLTVDNLGSGVPPKTASFDIDLGIQPALPSPHDISIEFFGGASCFILNLCPGTSSNWTDESIVPRTYTASNTPDPVLSISYDANGTLPLQSPAFDFANVPVNTTDTRTLYVRNVGGGTAVGSASIAGGANPFYCVGTCTYSILAGAPAVPIQVQYAPTSVGMNSTGVLAFGCTSINCAGVNANLEGSSVASLLPPQMGYLPYGFWFPNTIVGSYSDYPFTIENTGGGTLTGTIIVDQPEYTCVPDCNYSVPSGGSVPMTFRFTPTVGGTRYIDAHFTGNFPTIDKSGSGYGIDKPIAEINCVGCYAQDHWDIPTPVAPGQTVFQNIEVRNVGAGTLSGQIAPGSGSWNDAGWHCISVTQNGVTTMYTDANPCQYSNLTNGGQPAIVQMSFVGSIANVGPQSSSVIFTNDQNPGQFPWLYLSASVTLDPLLQINGLGGELAFIDTLINVSTYETVSFTNIGTTPLTFVINLPVGAGVFTCQNSLQCNAPVTIAAGDTVPVTFAFNPPTPYTYTQPFTVCVGGTCANYSMRGLGQNPQLGVMSIIPGGENMDLMQICAAQGGTCSFSGTQLVHYGYGTDNVSKLLSGPVLCENDDAGGPFTNPKPGYTKYCWISNPESGTWTNRPWSTSNIFRIYNSGIGGRVYYQITSPTNFKCSTSQSWSGTCQGHLTNSDEEDYTSTMDIDSAPIYFNPSVIGAIGESLTINYHFVAWDGYSPPDCNYCHTMTIPLTGTGIAGPHLDYTMGTFPLTNINSTSTATLIVNNDGTDPDLGVSVNWQSGEFSCTANCGPYDILPGGSFTATIAFHPLSAGTRNGSFSVDATPLGTPPSLTVPVSGVGNAAPILSILNPVAGSLDYGPVNQGSQRISGDWGPASSIVVTNTGAGLLTGDATIVGGTHYKCLVCHYEALAPGATQEIKIAFAPKNVGQLNDTVNFSGGGNGLIAFQLFGNGQLGASSVNSPDTDFGRVVIRAGNFKEQVVTVYNQGSVDVPAGDITMSGPFTCTHPPTPFNAVTNKCSYPVIPAGGSVQFTIRFTPTAPGPANGVITLGGSSNAKIRLKGTGVVPSVKFKEN